MLYSHMAQQNFRNSYDPKPFEDVNSFFRSGKKSFDVNRTELDGLPYHFMHSEFYGRACAKLISERATTHGLRFERILDFGGQSGAAYEYFSKLITLDQYTVVDRWNYSQQQKTLADLSLLPKVHLKSWHDYLMEERRTDEPVLILFSFSINEAHHSDQLRILHEAKCVYENATILVLDSAPTVCGLAHLGEAAEVSLHLPRPLHCFSDGHHLRRKLTAMSLWI